MNLSQHNMIAKHISEDQINAFRFPLPPKDEQLDILSFISTSTATIQKALSRTTREISLIEEYRTRLITDVVTGKIDVRNIDVPDVAEESLAETDSETVESDEYAEGTLEPAEVDQ